MVVVGVDHASAARERRDHEQRYARAVAEEVERLDEARIVEAAALVPGHDDRGFGKQFRLGLDLIDDVVEQRLKQVQLGGLRVTVDKTARFDEGNRRQV